MFDYTQAYSGMSIDDAKKAKAFYSDVLGLKVSEEGDALVVHLKPDTSLFLYPKPNHEPATYTGLNFEVENIEAAVRQLKEKGVSFEHYPGTDSGEDGISRNQYGPLIAWFKDPAGNILSVIQTS